MKPSRLLHSCTSICFSGRCIVSTLGAWCEDSSKHYKEILVNLSGISSRGTTTHSCFGSYSLGRVGVGKQKHCFSSGTRIHLPREAMSAGNQTTMFAALSEARDFLSQRAIINFTHNYFSRSISLCPFGLSRSPQVSVWLKLGPKNHGSSKKAYYRCLVLREKPIDIVVALLHHCLKTKRRHILFLSGPVTEEPS
jgi:hypothetical protein